MSRMSARIRDAVEGDAAALTKLWQDLLARPGAEGLGVPEMAQAEQSLARFRESKSSRVLVAESDGHVVGGVFLQVALVSPLHPVRALHISHLQVDRGYVRHGVGRALLQAAVSWAEELGLDTVLVGAAAGDRDMNRFLARLGLTQVAVLRSATTAALRSELPQDPSLVARGGARLGRNVGQVVAARRSQRRARGRDAVD